MSFLRIFFILCFSISLVYSQDSHWHKAKIILNGKPIQALIDLGLACDHGEYIPLISFESDFNHAELEKIEAAGFKIEIVPYKAHQIIERSGPFNCNPFSETPPTYPLPFNYEFGSMAGFLTLQEMYDNLELMQKLYPNLITKKQAIGNFLTYKKNPIYYFKISKNPTIDEEEPEVLYTALHHAREPLSMSQLLFYMWHLLENYDKDAEIKSLLDHRELFFVPCVNPDGYLYNEDTNPDGGGYWRKNRQPNPTDTGTDLNRNYGLGWGYNDSGSSPTGSSEVFRGSIPFSEVETKAIKFFCEQRDFSIALNYHSFGNLLIIPWGYLNTPTLDSALYYSIAESMTHHNSFKIGSSEELLGYSVNGVSDDWMYGDQRTKKQIYSFTPEIGSSFWPVRRDIIPINQSAQYMNLIAAWNAGECANLTDIGPIQIEADSGYVELELIYTGLVSEPITIIPKSSFGGLTFTENEFVFNVEPGRKKIVKIPYRLKQSPSKGDTLYLDFSLKTGAYQKSIRSLKLYSGAAIYHELCLDFNSWFDPNSNPWLLDTTDFVSSPSSFSDSPYGPSRKGTTQIMQNFQGFDLKNAVSAYLSFKAKWDLDPEQDYFQFKLSLDANNFHSVCGIYTSKGTSFQDENNPIYTGTQKEWRTEWIDLKDYLGRIVYPQLFFRSSTTPYPFDGFHLDDIKVYLRYATGIQQESSASFELFPQPAHDQITIQFEPGTDNFIRDISLISLDGKEIPTVYKLNHTQAVVNISGMHKGFYQLVLNLSNQKPQIFKVLIN